MAYMVRIPCASLSQRSNVRMKSASALICDLSRVTKGEELKVWGLKGRAQRFALGDTAGLCPAPRPILG